MKPVYCYNDEKIYPSVTAVALQFGTTKQIISDVMHGYRGLTHYKGNYFCYVNNIDLSFNIPSTIKITVNNMVLKAKRPPRLGRIHCCFSAFDAMGNKVGTYKTTAEAEKDLGCHRQLISHVLTGRSKSTGGYIFRRLVL